MWLEGVCEWEGVDEEIRVSKDLSHMGPGRSWELLLLLLSVFIFFSCPPQDPPSLDAAIQHALAGLYPPFEATASTILGQVFRLLDSDFQGDGLNFLLDFLIPAKRLCEQVREVACVS